MQHATLGLSNLTLHSEIHRTGSGTFERVSSHDPQGNMSCASSCQNAVFNDTDLDSYMLMKPIESDHDKFTPDNDIDCTIETCETLFERPRCNALPRQALCPVSPPSPRFRLFTSPGLPSLPKPRRISSSTPVTTRSRQTCNSTGTSPNNRSELGHGDCSRSQTSPTPETDHLTSPDTDDYTGLRLYQNYTSKNTGTNVI